MFEEAAETAEAATWAALCSALALYQETAAVLRLVVRSAPPHSLAFQDAVSRAWAAWQNLQTCWALHYGAPPPTMSQSGD